MKETLRQLMRVQINQMDCNFETDYNPQRPAQNGWKKQNQDAFKICQLGGKDVFIKRFDKHENAIPGYHFLIKVKNQKMIGLPMIYDIISVMEGGKSVVYLFQEVLKGKTLEERIHQDEYFIYDIQKIIKDLHVALSFIFGYGYWFADFVEKNIFVGDDGNYYLIDLDSVVSLSVLPNSDSPELSCINKNYKIAVSTYCYRDILGYPYSHIAQNLRGDTINILELLILIAQLNLYINKDGNIDFFSVETRRSNPQYLLSLNDLMFRQLFTSCFSDNNNNQRPLSLKELLSFFENVFGFDVYQINFLQASVSKITQQSIALIKGENVSFSKFNTKLSNIQLKLNWNISNSINHKFDVDIYAFQLTFDDVVSQDRDFIFYNNKQSHTGSVSIIDNKTILVNLMQIPQNIIKIVVGLSVYNAHINKINFNDMSDSSIYVIDGDTHQELFHFSLNESDGNETAIILGEIYHKKDEWKFRAVGQGYRNGLHQLCARYGLNVEHS